jgi:hypothetical protein
MPADSFVAPRINTGFDTYASEAVLLFRRPAPRLLAWSRRQKVERDFEKLRRQQTGRKGLLNFVRYFWHSLEPKVRPLIEGWPLEAICDHLEAMTFGDIPIAC